MKKLIVIHNQDENQSIEDYIIGEYPVISDGLGDLIIPYEKEWELDIKELLKDETLVTYEVIEY
jgi:hypothetical protein